MDNVLVVVNTKGGVGKSTIASQVLPVLFRDANKKIRIYEIDDNNRTFYENSKLEFRTLKIEKTEEAIDEVQFALDLGEDIINIVDAGGGNDTKAVLTSIRKAKLKDLTYLIPINDDFEQFDNVKNTIEFIRDFDASSKIFLIFNRVISLEMDDIKKQFIAFFGSDEYGIKGRMEEIMQDVEAKFLFIQNTQILSILKNVYHTTMYDFYHNNKDLIENIENYRKEWVKNGLEFFKEQMKFYRFTEDVFDLISYIDEYTNFLQDK